MAQLRIFGAVGKSTTRIMVDAILASAQVSASPQASASAPIVVALSPDPDVAGRPWFGALAQLDENTVAVVNEDLAPLALFEASGAAVTTFGLTDGADLRATDLAASLDGTAFSLSFRNEEHRVHLRLLGEHQVMNALAAIAVGLACAVPLEGAIAALEGLGSVGANRMHPIAGQQGRIIIDDTVSATPQSTAAALKTLALIAGERRSVAVLGQLSVPGDAEEAAAAHDRIGRLIVRLNVKKLVVVGNGARHIHNAAGLEGSWDGESVLVDTPQQAYDLLRDELREHDLVLVKSSHGLDGLAERLAEVTR